MSEALSFAEIEGQHVELLPARTVMSIFVTGGGSVCPASSQVGGGAGAFGNSQFQFSLISILPAISGGGTGNPGSAPANAAC
jgi:hypothetical protein